MIKGFSETIKNEVKGQVVFLGMLLSTLGANLLGNMLAGKGIIRAGEGRTQLVKEQLELVRIFFAA